MSVFSRFLDITCPESLDCEASGKNPAFDITFCSDGKIPFPQVILHGQGVQKLIRDKAIHYSGSRKPRHIYVANIPAGLLADGRISVQV